MPLSFSLDIARLGCTRRALLGGSAAAAGTLALGIRECGMAHDGPHEFTADELAQIDAVVTGFLESSGTPGAVVGLWIPERGSLVKTYGVGDVETGVAPTERDTFRIASNTKTFVATLLLQLVDEGLIGLDTPISEFDFEFPQSETATLAQLLGMTSGIFSYTEDETFAAEYIANPMMPGFTPQDALEIARAHDPYFAPGEGIHYSDTNTVIAGLIAEQLTGTSLPGLLSERIFVPELLHSTSFPVGDPAMPDPYMRGYTPPVDDKPMEDATESNPDVGWAAGAMISNLNDLSVWVELLATVRCSRLRRRRHDCRSSRWRKGARCSTDWASWSSSASMGTTAVSPGTAPSCFTIRTTVRRSWSPPISRTSMAEGRTRLRSG